MSGHFLRVHDTCMYVTYLGTLYMGGSIRSLAFREKPYFWVGDLSLEDIHMGDWEDDHIDQHPNKVGRQMDN